MRALILMAFLTVVSIFEIMLNAELTNKPSLFWFEPIVKLAFSPMFFIVLALIVITISAIKRVRSVNKKLKAHYTNILVCSLSLSLCYIIAPYIIEYLQQITK